MHGELVGAVNRIQEIEIWKAYATFRVADVE